MKAMDSSPTVRVCATLCAKPPCTLAIEYIKRTHHQRYHYQNSSLLPACRYEKLDQLGGQFAKYNNNGTHSTLEGGGGRWRREKHATNKYDNFHPACLIYPTSVIPLAPVIPHVPVNGEKFFCACNPIKRLRWWLHK